MVGPDHGSADIAKAGGASALVLGFRAALAVLALSVALGAFLQAQVLLDAELVAAGLRLPSLGWVATASDWLPPLFIGLGLSLISAFDPVMRRWVRLLSVAVVFIVAVAVALLREDQALSIATAMVLGVGLGFHADSARRIGLLGVVMAGAAAVISAVAVAAAPLALDGLSVSLVACVIALVLEPAPMLGRASSTRRWWLRACGWTAISALVVLTASSAAPTAVAVVAALGAVVLGSAACARLGVAVGAAASAFLLLLDAPTFAAAGTDRMLAREGMASVVYQRADQQLQVRYGREVLAAAGPDRGEEPLLEALLHALVRRGDVVTLLGRGTGRIEPSLRAQQRCVVEVLDAWPEPVAFEERARADGPVAPSLAADLTKTPLRQLPIAAVAAASRQLICVCELPISSTAHRATFGFQRALRRVVGDGLVLQPVAIDRVAPDLLDQLLSAARRAHTWNGVYRVGDAMVLVSGASCPTLGRDGGLVGADARWALHRAHLGGLADFELAFAGTIAGAPPRPSERSAASRLARWLQPASSSRRGHGQLAWWRRLRRELQRASERIWALSDDAAGRREAAEIAARFLACGAPGPCLQAALGLVGEDGVTLRDPRLQSRCAHTLDPTFFPTTPAVFGSLPAPTQPFGDLEDECRVVVSARLARRCSGESPLSVGLRARFPSRCARALVQALASGPLPPEQALALRELADPFVIDEVARLVLASDRWSELLTYWRSDLPLPDGLRAFAATLGAAACGRIAAELRTHVDPSCHGLLADLLLFEDHGVRVLAGDALRAAVGDRIVYDAKWSRSRREDAASQLLELHNRRL